MFDNRSTIYIATALFIRKSQRNKLSVKQQQLACISETKNVHMILEAILPWIFFRSRFFLFFHYIKSSNRIIWWMAMCAFDSNKFAAALIRALSFSYSHQKDLLQFQYQSK